MLRFMGMVEYFANTPTSTFGNFARALGGTNADIFAGDACPLADTAGSVNRVKCDKIGRTLPNTFGRRSSPLGGSFADVPSTPACLAPWAALPGLLPGSLRSLGRLLLGLGLAVLAMDAQAAEANCKCENCDARSQKWN